MIRSDGEDAPRIAGEEAEVGGDSATLIPYSFDRTNSWHVYQMPYTINTHANGLAHIRITATNSLGKSVTVSHEVLLDNVPAEMHIDSLSFSLAKPNCFLQIFHKEESELREVLQKLKETFKDKSFLIELAPLKNEGEDLNALPFL